MAISEHPVAAASEPVSVATATYMPSHTHEVTNQPPPLSGYDVFAQDAALVEGVRREGADNSASTRKRRTNRYFLITDLTG